jgi:hypothetical protein
MKHLATLQGYQYNSNFHEIVEHTISNELSVAQLRDYLEIKPELAQQQTRYEKFTTKYDPETWKTIGAKRRNTLRENIRQERHEYDLILKYMNELDNDISK